MFTEYFEAIAYILHDYVAEINKTIFVNYKHIYEDKNAASFSGFMNKIYIDVSQSI